MNWFCVFVGWGRSACFFVIFNLNGDLHKEIMTGNHPFGSRFGFAFFGGVAQTPFLSFLISTVIGMKRLYKENIRFGARFGFAFFGGVAQIAFLSFLVEAVIFMKRL